MKRTMALSAMTAVGLLCAAGQAQVVISQVYGGGGNSGAPFNQDFIELKNIGSSAVDITGWTVQEAAAGPTGTANNFTTSTRNTPPFPSKVLQPGQYYLIGGSFGSNTSLTALPTVDVNATNVVIATGNGKVVLVNNSTLIDINDPAYFDQTTHNPIYGPGSPIVDMVGFGNTTTPPASHFEGSGPTLAPSNSLSAVRKNNGCQDNNDNLNDFELLAPNPHNSTSTVPCGTLYPDLTLSMINSACNPTTGSSYDVTATVSNVLFAAAPDTVVTLVLPPALTYTSSNTGGTGTASYNPANRTVTWNVGTLGVSAQASITVSGTVTGEGGVVVKGSASTSDINEPVGNNTATSYSEVTSTATALSTILVASSTDSSIATIIDEGGTQRTLSVINRPFTSADGQWMILRGVLSGGSSSTNDVVVVGHNTAGAWSYSIVAHEGVTAPVAALSSSQIDANTFGNIQGINNSGEYVYTCRVRDQMGTPSDATDDTLHWVLVKGTVAGGVSMTITGANTGPGGGNAGADAPLAPELAGRFYSVISSSTIQNDGTVSFASTLTGTSTTNAVFVKGNGATVLAQKGVTAPNGGGGLLWSVMDDDGSTDGNGLFVSADGTAWLGTGKINSGDTSNDGVVVVNGTVAVREGSTVGTFTDPAGWNIFNSSVPQALSPWCQMNSDGTWLIQGYNPASANFNQGQDWINRGGVIIASTGEALFSGSTEHWYDGALQRTFFMEASSGSDYVVGGLTDRNTAANGSDEISDGVVVYRGSSVLVREGNPVTVVSTDGSNTPSTRYLNLINDNRSFISNGTLYMTATLRNVDSECTRNFTGLPQAIVAAALPTTNPCPADIGVQGGLPGSDGALDNNDFIAFITYFFAHDPHADLGIQGGFVGSDGAWDNNDFIAFITLFFQGCGH